MDPRDFEVEVKLIIKAKNTEEHTPALGKGIVSLCKLVDETGSLNKAAAEMGMAYSKAWSILKHAEESFDIQLLRRKGNKGSELTPEARRLRRTAKATRRTSCQPARRIAQVTND